MQTRRTFIQNTACALGLGALTSPLNAIKPLERSSHHFSGISLSAFSLRNQMKWAYGNKRDLPMDMFGFLDYCASLELSAAELTAYFFPEPLSTAEINKVKKHAHLLGINISGGAMGNNLSFPPGSPENVEHMKYFRKWVDHYAEMGAPAVRVFAARGLPDNHTDDQIIENVIANLESALEYAEKRGVMLGLENHDFVSDIDYLLRIVKAIDSKWLGITFDSANFKDSIADPYAEMARIAPYTITAQIKVKTKANGDHVSANYSKIVNILKKANYRGYLVFEYEEKEDPLKAIPDELRKLKKLI